MATIGRCIRIMSHWPAHSYWYIYIYIYIYIYMYIYIHTQQWKNKFFCAAQKPHARRAPSDVWEKFECIELMVRMQRRIAYFPPVNTFPSAHFPTDHAYISLPDLLKLLVYTIYTTSALQKEFHWFYDPVSQNILLNHLKIAIFFDGISAPMFHSEVNFWGNGK